MEADVHGKYHQSHDSSKRDRRVEYPVPIGNETYYDATDECECVEDGKLEVVVS